MNDTPSFPQNSAGSTSFRLVLLTHEFAPFHGGVATYSYELAKALHEKGALTAVWAPGRGYELSTESNPFWTERLNFKGKLDPYNILRLTSLLIQRRFELANIDLIATSYGSQLALMLAEILGVPIGKRIVCIWHGSEIIKFRRDPLLFTLAWKLFQHPRVIWAAASRFTQNMAEQLLLKHLQKPVHLLRCAPSSAACQEVSFSDQDMNTGKFRILTVARLHPRKGQIDTVRALAMMPDNLKSRVIYEMVGIGDSNYLQSIKAVCRNSNIEFRHLGAVSSKNIGECYRKCDLFVMTSRSLEKSIEGFGIAYLEAGSYGKPSVGYDCGGVSEAILHERTGILVREGDLEVLSKAIARMISDDQLRAVYGTQARLFAKSFGWESTARELLDILA